MSKQVGAARPFLNWREKSQGSSEVGSIGTGVSRIGSSECLKWVPALFLGSLLLLEQVSGVQAWAVARFIVGCQIIISWEWAYLGGGTIIVGSGPVPGMNGVGVIGVGDKTGGPGSERDRLRRIWC
jgi:hypothetical protein